MAVSPITGYIYLVLRTHEIRVVDSSGALLRTIGQFGFGKGSFFNPLAIAFDAEGNFAVTESANSRVQVFDEKGILSSTNKKILY